jgi:hypothetical protein
MVLMRDPRPYLRWLIIRAKNQPKRVAMEIHLWWLKRKGKTVVYVESGTVQQKKLVDYKSEMIHRGGNAARVVLTLAPSKEFTDWARANISQNQFHMWAQEDGGLHMIFDKPEEAFSFKMVWG